MKNISSTTNLSLHDILFEILGLIWDPKHGHGKGKIQHINVPPVTNNWIGVFFCLHNYRCLLSFSEKGTLALVSIAYSQEKSLVKWKFLWSSETDTFSSEGNLCLCVVLRVLLPNHCHRWKWLSFVLPRQPTDKGETVSAEPFALHPCTFC